ncbi:PaREP1 family protein [Stygiolobus sp. CP8521M]|uniref:PaREP1 family protein n=1 Tax=Stygiolobus sp. CP8521M TaxID=3133136 RepID=UPI00307D69AE
MYEVLDYKENPKSYIHMKVMESLVESRLALEMLKRGLLTNASSKAFISTKAFISALIVKDFDKIIQNKPEKEKEWYERIGYSSSTTGLIGVSYDLEKLGYNVGLVVRIALSLHSFSYNGFDPNLVNYKDKEEVEKDIKNVVQFVIDNAKKYFNDFWNEELEKEWENLVNVSKDPYGHS